MIVMKYYESGNLYQYLDRSNGILLWKDIIDILWGIAGGLEKIHSEGKIHKNIHGGNLLVDEKVVTDTRISDVGFYGPCYYHETNQIYGVLPYIAPEVLRGENYTIASDIYSFGIIMNTFATGKRPWYNRAHNINLAKDICDGERLEIPEDTPSFYAELMQRCWDDDPKKRPNASYLNEKMGEWITLICDSPNPSDIFDEYNISEDKRWKIISHLPRDYVHPEIHPEASYVSRPLYFLNYNIT
jgi:serine/threonine protein kinase